MILYTASRPATRPNLICILFYCVYNSLVYIFPDKSKEEDWPSDIFTPDDSPPQPPQWISLFPFIAIPLYYTLGFFFFGVLRGKSFPEIMLFPLDFTAAGGVASTYGPLRVAYAIYLEGAVLLASTNVALLRVTATRGFTTLGIKLGIMINNPK